MNILSISAKTSRIVKQNGFSLIELILLIVIIGIAASILLLSLQSTLRNSPTANHQTVAIGLAQERMELILGQKQINGFNSFTDPCTGSAPPAICTSLTGYSVTATIASITIGSDSNYKKITVTTSGLGSAVLTALVAS